MENKVSAVLTDQDLTDIENDLVTTVLSKMPFLIAFEENERKIKAKRVMGNHRAGLVKDVLKGVTIHSGDMPQAYNITEFNKDFDLEAQLTKVKDIFISRAMLKIEDTLIQVSREIMQQTDIGYAMLKTVARTNTLVRDTVKQIAENNKGMGRRPNLNIYEIAKSGSLIINKTIPETLVTNCGYASMKLAGGPELTSGVKKPVITLLPGTSAELPKGYTQIYVTNDSADTTAMIALRLSK